MLFRKSCCVVLLVLFWISVPNDSLLARQKEELLKNTDFVFDGDQLTDWEVGDGAGGGSVVSKIGPASDGALELSGNAETQLWKFVAQEIDVAPGDFLKLTYEARAFDLRREAGQNDNCYVGFIFANREGGNPGITYYPVTDEDFAGEVRLVKVPQGAASCKAMVFLSKTGNLQVKNISVQKAAAEESFSLLVQQMDRYYSYFEHKKVDWNGLVDKYRARATAAKKRKEFESVVLEMLAELKDGHIWIMRGGQRKQAWSQSKVKRNYDFRAVDRNLKNIQKFGRIGLVARTKKGNLGYVRVTSLAVGLDEMRPMLKAIAGIFDTDGMIVDLRANGGGSEDLGLVLAGAFCKEPVTYAINRFRKNEKHNEFVENPRLPLSPIRGDIYDKPVVALIGAGAVSSAEGTALMFQALPNVTLVGQPTRGSTGNPAGVTLPNGTEVWFSRWVACNADGEPIEDRGVQPDIEVEHAKGDTTFKRAVGELTK